MRQDIVTALNYFKRETPATAVFIHIPEGVAYLIEDKNATAKYGLIPASELDEFVGRLKAEHQIQIIAQRDKCGNYVLPDIELLEFEKEIDY